jgi:hypothetical protein
MPKILCKKAINSLPLPNEKGNFNFISNRFSV